MICEKNHKNIRISQDSTFEWCQYCGTITYHVYPKTNTCHLKQIKKLPKNFYLFNPEDIRIGTHEHNWEKLTSYNLWCPTCGTLKISRIVCTRLTPQIKSGFLIPQCRISRHAILHDCGLDMLLNSEHQTIT